MAADRKPRALVKRIVLTSLLPLLAAQEPVFRSGVSLVRVDAQVTQGTGSIAGLQKEDFAVKDNDRPQTLLYCTQDEEALDLMLLFDISGSMQRSVRRVAASGRVALRELRLGDRVAVADFNTNSFLLAPFTADLAQAAANVDRVVDLPFGGGTHILSSVNDAALYLKANGDPHRRRAILIVTDNQGQSSMREKSLVDRMWEADVVLCGLIVKSHEGIGLAMAQEDMLGTAEKTGGEVVNADDPGQSFGEMLHRLRKRYSLYYDMPSGKPGSARRVAVELSAAARRRYPEAQVLARKGYLIPKS
jgi:VWFA-related protein